MDCPITSYYELLTCLIKPELIEEASNVLSELKNDLEASMFVNFNEINEFTDRAEDFCNQYSTNSMICVENANRWIAQIIVNNTY